jgi:hypothetical protein
MHQQPEAVGMDSTLLDQAVAYAKTRASTIPPDFSKQVETFGRVLGPLPKERGPTNGLIIRHGYIVAEWGDPIRWTRRIAPPRVFLDAGRTGCRSRNDKER